MRRLGIAALLLGLAGLLLPACSESTGSVTIGALYPTNGPQAEQGTEELRGVRLAVEWANDHLPRGGKRVRLLSVSADRSETVPAAMAALERRGAQIIVGSHGSNLSAVAAE